MDDPLFPDKPIRRSSRELLYSIGRAQWYDSKCVPAEELLRWRSSTDKGVVLLVDVGRSISHDLEGFHKQHHKLPGRLVLQDLAEVIACFTKLTLPIEALA
jgi:hypothetical protein